jgi:hypothetical protein
MELRQNSKHEESIARMQDVEKSSQQAFEYLFEIVKETEKS